MYVLYLIYKTYVNIFNKKLLFSKNLLMLLGS